MLRGRIASFTASLRSSDRTVVASKQRKENAQAHNPVHNEPRQKKYYFIIIASTIKIEGVKCAGIRDDEGLITTSLYSVKKN